LKKPKGEQQTSPWF